MELRIYVNFGQQEILTEKEFEERKKCVLQDLIDDEEFLSEYLEEQFYRMVDLFTDLESRYYTIEEIKKNYCEWLKEKVENNDNLNTSLDEFEEYYFEV